MVACTKQFEEFAAVIADVFRTKTRDSSSHARAYLSGLLTRIQRKNMERMCESLAAIKHQDMQQFRSDSEVKYSLSNAPDDTSKSVLAARHAQRFFIERAFQDGKTESGMGQYQARKWWAWEHHMARVGAAMMFAQSGWKPRPAAR